MQRQKIKTNLNPQNDRKNERKTECKQEYTKNNFVTVLKNATPRSLHAKAFPLISSVIFFLSVLS